MSPETKSTAHLLKIPIEIRLEIYRIFMDMIYEGDGPYGSPMAKRRSALLFASACHQIRNELFPLCIARTVFFLRGFEMMRWPRRTAINFPGVDLLSLTRKVSITLRSDDVSTIACMLRNDLVRKSGPQTFREELYFSRVNTDHRECTCQTSNVGNIMLCDDRPHAYEPDTLLKGICDAFTRLKHLTSFDLDCHSSQNNFETDELVLRMAGANLSNLEVLIFRGQEVPLDFLEGFPKLRELSISGFSKSAPTQTSRILNSLKRLESLTLWRTCGFSGYESETRDTESGYDSITSDVLASMNPLKQFSLELGAIDGAGNNAVTGYLSQNSIHLATIQALHEHINSLQALEISHRMYRTTMDAPTLRCLLSFLATTKTLRQFSIDIYIPGSCDAIDFPSFFPKHIPCGELIIEDHADNRRLGFMGSSKHADKYPTVCSPVSAHMMKRYWNRIDGKEYNQERDEKSATS